RPPDRAAPADNGGQRNLDREHQKEEDVRLEEGQEDAVDAAPRRRQRGRQHEGTELDVRRVDAGGHGGVLVLAHGAQLIAETALRDEGGDANGGDRERQGEVVLREAREEVDAEGFRQGGDEDAGG